MTVKDRSESISLHSLTSSTVYRSDYRNIL